MDWDMGPIESADASFKVGEEILLRFPQYPCWEGRVVRWEIHKAAVDLLGCERIKDGMNRSKCVSIDEGDQ
jgi:hypothetical protein